MPARLPLVVAAALLTAAGCSATTADISSSPSDSGPTGTRASTATSGTADATSTTEETLDSTTTSSTESAQTTVEAESTTTTEKVTTTTLDTVVPIPLPEREIADIGVRAAPLEPAGTSSGDAMNHAQWRLLELGFWVESANGRYDNTTQQAVMAFQKYYGLEPDGSLGPITAEMLSSIDERPQGTSTTGTLVEVDKAKQLIFIIKDGVVQWILNTSTGTEIPYDEINKNTGQPERGNSVTRTGLFEVNRERPEGWWAGDLGKIYRPKYFDGGIALHGSNFIPAYPASHGCVRMSTNAMDFIWDNDIVPKGTPVWVHGDIPA